VGKNPTKLNQRVFREDSITSNTVVYELRIGTNLRIRIFVKNSYFVALICRPFTNF
jgi:hypothetical protein